MPHYVITELKRVKAKGLNRSYVPVDDKLRELVVDYDWEKLGLLSDISSQISSSLLSNLSSNFLSNSLSTSSASFLLRKRKERPVLFYPGCGQDILYLLLFLEKIGFSFEEADFIFNDIDNIFGLIKTILDEVGIGFVEEKSGTSGKVSYGEIISFYWKEQLIHLRFVQGDIFELLPHLPVFDLYFERAFRLMKEDHREYEPLVFHKLNLGGVLISDSGYVGSPLKRIELNSAVSSYGQMIMGVK